MCDTIIATADAAKDGGAVFGKNSDREPNEVHHLVRHPATDFTPESCVRCTHMEIPQAKHTFAVVLAKPFWSDASLPDLGPNPVSIYDPATLFWRHEILHRSTLHDHEKLVATFRGSGKELCRPCRCQRRMFVRADDAEAAWLERV